MSSCRTVAVPPVGAVKAVAVGVPQVVDAGVVGLGDVVVLAGRAAPQRVDAICEGVRAPAGKARASEPTGAPQRTGRGE